MGFPGGCFRRSWEGFAPHWPRRRAIRRARSARLPAATGPSRPHPVFGRRVTASRGRRSPLAPPGAGGGGGGGGAPPPGGAGGMGETVGVGVEGSAGGEGVGVNVAVATGVGETPGVTVGAGGVGVAVAEGVGVRVGVGVNVTVATGVGETAGVAVGVGGGVGVGPGVGNCAPAGRTWLHTIPRISALRRLLQIHLRMETSAQTDGASGTVRPRWGQGHRPQVATYYIAFQIRPGKVKGREDPFLRVRKRKKGAAQPRPSRLDLHARIGRISGELMGCAGPAGGTPGSAARSILRGCCYCPR